MAAVTIWSDFGAQENKVWHCFPIYLPWSDGTRCHDLRFLNVELSAKFFTLLFHFHQRLFSSSSLSAISVVSSAFLRLLIFLPEILIPACASSRPAFLMMFSAYKLNEQGNNNTALTYSFSYLEPVCCSMSSSNCCFLTYIHISHEADHLVWYSQSLSEFSTVYCDPHSQRLWRSQWSRNICFSGTLLLFRWSIGCWQFNLWFLCLF